MYLKPSIIKELSIQHLAHINFSNFRAYCSIISVRGRLLASPISSLAKSG